MRVRFGGCKNSNQEYYNNNRISAEREEYNNNKKNDNDINTQQRQRRQDRNHQIGVSQKLSRDDITYDKQMERLL